MTAPHTPQDDHDLKQLTGAFDRPIEPSPQFADGLKQRLEKETAMQRAPATPMAPVSNRTAQASAINRNRPRWIDIAIAAALIVAMLGSTFWYAGVRIGNDGPSAPPATHYAAQPLSSLSTPVSEIAVTSDPGDTLSFPAGFDLKTEHDVISLDGLPPAGEYAAVAGDTLVVAGALEGDPEKQLYAIDLPSGSLLWTSDLVSTWDFVVSGNRIFGAFWEPESSDHAAYAMMSISVETGEVLWSGPTIADFGRGLDVVPPGYARDLFRPVVIGNAVYYTNQDGQVIARHAHSGETLWADPVEQASPEPGQGNPGQIVGDEKYIYATDRQNAILRLDRHTGEEIDRFLLADRPAPGFVMDIHLRGGTLIVMSHTSDLTLSFVDAISIDTGEVLWSYRLGTAGPFITMTEDVVAVPHQVAEAEVGNVSGDITEPGLYVSFFDLDSGESVSLYGPSDAAFATASSSGSVVCINEATVISCIDTASDTRTLVQLPYAPGGESFMPFLFWNDTAIVLDMDDGVTLLRPKNAQPQQADLLPGDPGNTNAYPETLDLDQTFTAEPLGDGSVRVLKMVVIEDALIYIGTPITSSLPVNVNDQVLGSIDIPTGKENWIFEHASGDMWPIRVATDGKHVYATLDNVAAGTFRVVSLDSATGDIRWESDDLHELAGHDLEPYVDPGELIVVGETVLIPYGPETLLALDRNTGEARWSLIPSEDEDTDPETNPMPAASIVANHDTVFRSLPSGAVQEISVATGETLAETPNPEDRWPLTRISLHLRGDYLIVRRGYIPGDTPENGRIDVYNITTRQAIWTTSTDRYLGDILVTDDVLIVPGSLWKDPSLLERVLPFLYPDNRSEISILSFDLETGESLNMFSDAGDFQNFPDFSAAGDTICMSAYTVRCIDGEGSEMSVEGYETDQYVSFIPPVYWNGNIVIGNGTGPIMIAKPRP